MRPMVVGRSAVVLVVSASSHESPNSRTYKGQAVASSPTSNEGIQSMGGEQELFPRKLVIAHALSSRLKDLQPRRLRDCRNAMPCS